MITILRKKLLTYIEIIKCLTFAVYEVCTHKVNKSRSHHLSTMRHCEKNLVLDEGQIFEDGIFEKLIEKNGFFCELLAKQQ